MKNTIEDLKSLRNWTLGIIGFATTVATVLVQAFHFRLEPTVIAVAGFACALILIVFLIQRSEDRTNKMLQDHITTADAKVDEIQATLDEIKSITLENQRASLRIELGNEIKRHPENHDTIFKMAERYFCELQGDWYMTSKFLSWAENEKIKLPDSLAGIKNH